MVGGACIYSLDDGGRETNKQTNKQTKGGDGKMDIALLPAFWLGNKLT